MPGQIARFPASIKQAMEGAWAAAHHDLLGRPAHRLSAPGRPR